MKVRRVVTGFDAEGRSVVTSDDSTRVELFFDHLPGMDITWLWSTDESPPPLSGPDLTLQPWTLQPPGPGLNWQIIVRPPDEDDGGTEQPPGAQFGRRDHRTDSLDLILIMSGEVWLYVGEDSVLLQAGDTVVQRGTDHRWVNRSSESCVMLSLMVSTRAAGADRSVDNG